MNPWAYPQCDQTVTVYRLREGQVQRQVMENCFYRYEDGEVMGAEGFHQVRKCLLIQPGREQQVFCGDRVMAGIGPEITPDRWESFVPVSVPTLCQIAYATPWYWDGHICHTEAGRK